MRIVFIVLIAQIILSAPSQALNILVSSTIQPYIITKNSGLHIDIINATLAEMDHEASYIFASNKRIEHFQHAKDIDIITHTKKIESSQWFYTNHPIESFFNMAIIKNDRGIALTSIQDLAKIRVAAWQNAHLHLGDDYYAMTKKNKGYKEFSSHMPSFMLARNRVDAVISEPNIFMYNLVKGLHNPGIIQTEYKLIPLFKEPNLYWWGFSSAKLRDEFESALKVIYEKGIVDDIVNRYQKKYRVVREPLWSLDCHYGGIQTACPDELERQSNEQPHE
jgi:polar amino acid transport system substrate-binding protein